MESGSKFLPLPGQRFCPMEDELLMFYLKPKVNGMQVPGEGDVICEFDLYGDQDPWKIWNKFEARRANDLRRNKDLYFFTQKKKKTARGSRANRTVGRGGTWKGQNRGKEVYLDQKPTSTLLGFKKTYTYKNKGSVHDGGWIMYEFELHESQIHNKKQANKNDYVLCLLRKQINDVLLEKKTKRPEEDQDEILEDFFEVSHAENIDPEPVLEDPQGKRRRLGPCTDYVPTPSLEAEQENFVVSDQEFLQSEPFPSPLENEQAFLQMAMDDNMGLLIPPMLDEAELQQLYNEEFLQPAPALEAEQGGQTLMEAEPVDAHHVVEKQIDEGQRREETTGQQSQTPTFSANEIVCGLDFQQEENLVQQMGAEASSEVVVYGGNFVDAMVGEGWSIAFMEDLLNDKQPNTMEVGDWDAAYSDFGYNLAF